MINIQHVSHFTLWSWVMNHGVTNMTRLRSAGNPDKTDSLPGDMLWLKPMPEDIPIVGVVLSVTPKDITIMWSNTAGDR